MTLDPPDTLPPDPVEEEVARVICASVVSDANNVYATMEDIRDSAMRHNVKQGIHTALLYQSGWFLHWAEGPVGAVSTLFDRVRRDHRHNAQHVVHRSRGRRLLMNAWSMMLSPATENPEAFGERVMAIRTRMQQGSQFSPTSVVRRLLMPMQLKEALELPDPEAYHRVVVCAAAGNGGFDLVKWLAERHGAPRSSRRHAGETDLDSGSEYVDFMHKGHPCRVIAAARSNLSQGLHRSLMPDWEILVALQWRSQARHGPAGARARRLYRPANRSRAAGHGAHGLSLCTCPAGRQSLWPGLPRWRRDLRAGKRGHLGCCAGQAGADGPAAHLGLGGAQRVSGSLIRRRALHCAT